MINRRTLLAQTSFATAAMALGGCVTSTAVDSLGTGPQLSPFFADLEERTFRFFWDLVNRENGLVPDRWPSPSFGSIAAVGFALTAYPIGVERGWCSRKDARDLTLTTLRFFWNAPQGDAYSGVSGHKGFFYHFLDMNNGHRFKTVELSSIDTSLLFMGMLFAAEYFDQDTAAEAEIRKLASDIYARADWSAFMSDGRKAISMGWHPETGLIARNWDGYIEGMFIYILALAAPRFPVPFSAWEAWIEPYPKFWRGQGETRHLAFAPMFGHQYAQMWIDYRGIQDATMREAGLDYFENSRRATYANRAYCVANPMKWEGYSRDIWGLTACDGPGSFKLPFKGKGRQFYGYAARGPLGQPDELDDGTMAPTAALGSLPFAPEICIPAAEALRKFQGGRLYGKYGFLDSFNPSFTYQGKSIDKGNVDPEFGWVNDDYIGIDQGPILCQLANYRSDFVWKYMRKSAPIRLGLERAGFKGGWLSA